MKKCEVKFRFAKLGLNRRSRDSLGFSFLTFILELIFFSLCCFGIFILTMPPILIEILFMFWLILLVAVFALGVATACIALVKGIMGLLEPNPSFGRALCVAILPFLAFLPVVNILFPKYFCYLFDYPTAKERNTARAMGISLPISCSTNSFEVLADAFSPAKQAELAGLSE